MPHVIVKLWPGKSEQQKKKLAAELTKAATSMLHYGAESVSVGIEEVPARDLRRFTSRTFLPSEKRYKEFGYDPDSF